MCLHGEKESEEGVEESGEQRTLYIIYFLYFILQIILRACLVHT
jgi:hypothetical protein